MPSDDHTNDVPGAKRDRSPNYPIIGFRSALDATRKIYTAEKRHAMKPDVAAKHMGYTLNGRSKSMLSALKKYGLVEASPDGIRVSDDAVALFHYQPATPEYQTRARALPMRPEIFREIIEQGGFPLPSDDNLRARLVHNRKFSPEAANACIASLRESVEFLSALDPSTGVADTPTDTTPETTVPPTSQSAASTPAPRPAPAATPVGNAPAPYRFPLGGGVDVELRFTGAITKKQITMLKKQIDLLADALDDGVKEGTM